MAAGGCVKVTTQWLTSGSIVDSPHMTPLKVSTSSAKNSPRLSLGALGCRIGLESSDTLNNIGKQNADRTENDAIVDIGNDDLPSFRWPLKVEPHRFCSSWGERIPVVDLEGLWSQDPCQRAKVVRDIGAACRRWGFLQVCNHAVSPSTFHQLQTQEQAFFALPKAVKKRYTRTFDNIYGYHDREVNGLESISNWAEYFDVGPKPWVKRVGYQDNLGGVAKWPCELEGFRVTLEAYFRHMERLSVALLTAILESLPTNESPSVLASKICANHNSLLRVVKYPRCPDPDHILGYNSHTDSGLLSIIQQNGVEGLQVMMDDEWVTIEPKEGHFVVNVGDMLQVLTNGIYNTTGFSPIAPLQGLLSASSSARYRPVPWSEFRGRRIRSEFGDKSSIVAISEYEVLTKQRDGA
ncbi:2-oxoglutarate (2OG) and Fe(II)-dependent oxygenase superfamily protein [Klebsormidium nitens]|uniref:2-oxoglutarate (2OG) and Fe(II)-dependent oxygenase superfamily protein n=1 Tax=Klebsormidium nitens TaxID=105231 RepID=A0A1Y1IF13_KLENI|nr:2-oxoglutarate (2OG) and Fe(II)-dependent oxygenase superfamily protein [Klebsormidium nitens]|eukprot:GAQ87346.1 2-oxoglutarate (2OG) and Fe(II)-dependent oxygenase superfamily protein [Klebsormidium nitens]